MHERSNSFAMKHLLTAKGNAVYVHVVDTSIRFHRSCHLQISWSTVVTDDVVLLFCFAEVLRLDVALHVHQDFEEVVAEAAAVVRFCDLLARHREQKLQ